MVLERKTDGFQGVLFSTGAFHGRSVSPCGKSSLFHLSKSKDFQKGLWYLDSDLTSGIA